MNHRTSLLALLIAGTLAAPVAFAQDATSADQQAQPVSGQADVSAQQPTSADASAMQGDANAAASEQAKTSGDAGMATTASSAQAADSSIPEEDAHKQHHH